MRIKIDMTGQKFGKLTVIRRNYPNARDGHQKWLCKCECGIEKAINRSSLMSGNTKSCGCFRKEYMSNKTRIKPGLSNMRSLIANYKKSAKNKGHSYELTEKQFAEITQQNCHYCGAKPNGIASHSKQNGDYIYNGLDRINNTKGYTIDNVVPCCKLCNYKKSDMSLQEFEDWIKKVYKKIEERNG